MDPLCSLWPTHAALWRSPPFVSKRSLSSWPTHWKPWPCSSGGMMVGRNSSMLLMAFCMTVSNTHSRGRHSSSISCVDDAGKYLGNSHTHTHTHTHIHRARTDVSTNRRRQSKDRLEVQIHTLIHCTQLNWGSKQRIIRRINYTITEDETYSLQLLIKAFRMWSTELQTSTERRCLCLRRGKKKKKKSSFPPSCEVHVSSPRLGQHPPHPSGCGWRLSWPSTHLLVISSIHI